MRLSTIMHGFVWLSLSVGLAYAEDGYEDPTLDWMPENIDWRDAEVVTIELGDHVFSPDEVILKQNKPYKLVLDNISRKHAHDLVDPALFHAVVMAKVRVNGVTINTPHIHNAKLRPNNKAVFYLLPVKPGEYEIFCSIPNHREDGMEGTITIVAANDSAEPSAAPSQQ